ncbi:MAG: hypothetical protein ACTHJW_20565 [Streptosporangiaceae bacterium]
MLNHGFAWIGSLSLSVGAQRFGTAYRYRSAATGRLDGDILPVDLGANAASLEAQVIRTSTIDELADSLQEAKSLAGPVVITIEMDPLAPDSHSWWDVPPAEVSELASVRQARAAYESAQSRQRRYP